MVVIDATNLILGRLASYAAKQALLGEQVSVINCESAVMTGDKKKILARFIRFRQMGWPTSGPFIHRYPDRIVKRTIRGMLPYKMGRGRDAFKRVRCYLGVPEKLQKESSVTVDTANISKIPNLKYVDLKTISQRLGAKFE